MDEDVGETMELVITGTSVGPYAVLGRFVRGLREAKGLTATELSEKSGLHKNRITRLEQGENVEIAQYYKYAKGLGYRNILEMFRSPADPQTRRLLRLWAALDEEARMDALERMRLQIDAERE